MPSGVEVFELLDDECARRVLAATVENEKAARDLVDELDASRATIYRRLDWLENAGLVEATVEYDADGHHRRVFRATLDAVTVSLGEDTISTTVDVTGGTARADE